MNVMVRWMLDSRSREVRWISFDVEVHSHGLHTRFCPSVFERGRRINLPAINYIAIKVQKISKY